MRFKIGDRVELLQSAFAPEIYDPYSAYDADGSRLENTALSPGMRGKVIGSHSINIPKIKFDVRPAISANVRAEHLKNLGKLYGNEEE